MPPDHGTRCYRLHGLRILSAVPLGGDEIEPAPGDAITLTLDPAGVLEPTPPDARTLSYYEFPDGARYSHVQTAHGFLSTYFDKVQFQLSADRSTIRACLAPGLGSAWLQIFMAASYPAFLLLLAGRVPLHASAVWLPCLHGAVALLGTPGSGKSTLAGALCLAGGRLISDDLLSLDPGMSVPACEPGSRQLRLRQPSDELSARFDAQRFSESSDDRLVVDAREDLPGTLTLKALIQPVLDPQAATVQLEKLSAVEAFQAVACDPRIKGLSDPVWIKAVFEHAGRLVREVPVYRVTVPYAERNIGEIGRSLAGAILGSDAGRRAELGTGSASGVRGK